MSRVLTGFPPLWCTAVVVGCISAGVGCQREVPTLNGLAVPTVDRAATSVASTTQAPAVDLTSTIVPRLALVREMGGSLWVHLGDAPPLTPEERDALADASLMQTAEEGTRPSIVSTPPVAVEVPPWLATSRTVRLLDAAGNTCIGTVGAQRTIYAWQPLSEQLDAATGLDPETQQPVDAPVWSTTDWIARTVEVAQGDVWAQLTTEAGCSEARWAVADEAPTLTVASLAETIGMTDEAWQQHTELVASWQQLPSYVALQEAYDGWRQEQPADPPWPEEVLNEGVGAFGFLRLGTGWAVAGAVGEGCGGFVGSSWTLFRTEPPLSPVAVADPRVSAELPTYVLIDDAGQPMVAGPDWVAWQTPDGWERREARITMLGCGC